MEQDISKLLYGILDELKGINAGLTIIANRSAQGANYQGIIHESNIEKLSERIGELTEAIKPVSKPKKKIEANIY